MASAPDARTHRRNTGRLHLGCAVWAYPGWNGGFYPRGTRSSETLSRYAERLTAVEGNTTFYAIPPASSVERWAREMPEGFRFCPKLPRELSHQGRLMPQLAGTRSFLEHLEPLWNRLGLVFVQLPASYGPESGADLFEFLAAWPNDRVPVGVELRHPGWFQEPIRSRWTRAMRTAGATNVILDTRPIFEGTDDPQRDSNRKKPRLPVNAAATAGRCMVRYIGHPEHARNVPHLERWAKRVADWLREGRDVLFFCHCPQEEHSPQLARYFDGELRKHVPDLAPLPWDALPRPSEQLELF